MNSLVLRSALLALALALGGCATPPPEPAPEPATLVWPSPPDEARVVYVKSISGPKDLGITKSFLRRAFEFVFGEAQERLIRPMSVVEVGGMLYVADPGAHGVHRFDRKDGSYTLLGGADGAVGGRHRHAR